MKDIVHIIRFGLFISAIVQWHFAYSMDYVALDSTKGNCITYKTIESSDVCYKLHINIHGIHTMPIKAKDDTIYQHLSIGTPHTLLNTGAPALPVITKLLKVPKGANIKLSIKENCWSDIPISTIYPAQDNYFDDEPQKTFSINDSIYHSTGYFPTLASMSEIMTYRDGDYVMLRVCPFRYFPTENKLSVLSDFNVTVGYTYTISQDVYIRSYRQDIQHELPTDYLIIVGDIPNVINSQPIQDLKMWKALKGYKTKVVSTNETGTTYSSIKNYISQEYSNSNHSLKYVLLIGESLKIPMGKTSSPYSPETSEFSSDYWYGCMDGPNDRVADIAIGRIPIIYTSDIYNTVPKIINYESLPFPNAKDVLLVTGQEDASFFELCTETIRSNTYNTNFTFHTAYGGNGAWNQDVIDYANNGINILNYRGHASEEGWFGWNTHDEDFSGFDLNRFNQGTYFILMNIACLTGNLSFRFSMIYTFLTYEDAAAGFLGSLIQSKHYANSSYNIHFYHNLLNERIHHIGELNNLTHLDNDLTQQDSYYNALISICGGDPALEIWTGAPLKVPSVSVSVDSDSTFVLTAGVDSATISIVSEEGILLGLKAFNGSLTLDKPAEIRYYAINKHNYLPYVFKIDPTSNIIQNQTFATNTFLWNTPITIGKDVTTTLPEGNVTIKNGNSLNITRGSGVTIKNGFEVEKGAQLIIQ